MYHCENDHQHAPEISERGAPLQTTNGRPYLSGHASGETPCSGTLGLTSLEPCLRTRVLALAKDKEQPVQQQPAPGLLPSRLLEVAQMYLQQWEAARPKPVDRMGGLEGAMPAAGSQLDRMGPHQQHRSGACTTVPAAAEDIALSGTQAPPGLFNPHLPMAGAEVHIGLVSGQVPAAEPAAALATERGDSDGPRRKTTCHFCGYNRTNLGPLHHCVGCENVFHADCFVGRLENGFATALSSLCTRCSHMCCCGVSLQHRLKGSGESRIPKRTAYNCTGNCCKVRSPLSLFG
jgi:hypothetical protein